LLTLAEIIFDDEYPTGRYGLYVAMRREAPGAEVVVTLGVPSLSDHFAKAVGAAADVRRSDLSEEAVLAAEAVIAGREADVAGEYRWALGSSASLRDPCRDC